MQLPKTITPQRTAYPSHNFLVEIETAEISVFTIYIPFHESEFMGNSITCLVSQGHNACYTHKQMNGEKTLQF